MEKGQKKSPISECLPTDEIGAIEQITHRLQRYSKAKHRGLSMVDYIRHTQKIKDSMGRLTADGKLALDLNSCGSYLLFKQYLGSDSGVSLHSATFCRKHLLCPFCAIRRAVKYVQAYRDRLELILRSEPFLRPFMVTLTVRDGDSLQERFSALRGALKRYQQQRRNALVGRMFVEYAKALGGVFSIEVKRGSGSGLWHPHVHAIWLCRQPPVAEKLSREWLDLTGDSFIVDVRPFYGDSVVDGFLEVFKYALKFSDMQLSDNWLAYKQLSGKRLLDSFGLFRGVQVSEDLTDDDLEDTDFVYLFYRFFRASGYRLVNRSHDLGSAFCR